MDEEADEHTPRGTITEVGRYERKRQLRVFMVNVALSFVVVSFSLGMLVFDYSCQSKSTFVPLVTFVLGFWMDRPRA